MNGILKYENATKGESAETESLQDASLSSSRSRNKGNAEVC